MTSVAKSLSAGPSSGLAYLATGNASDANSLFRERTTSITYVTSRVGTPSAAISLSSGGHLSSGECSSTTAACR